MKEKKIVVDAIGDTCPIPVVKTKKAIGQLGGSGTVVVYVDNEIAVQNLSKMAVQKGYQIRSEKQNDQKYMVLLHVDADAAADHAAEEEPLTCSAKVSRDLVVAVSSSMMGEGDAELGRVLMKGFLYALTQQDILPKTILFYNSGAFLTCGESDTVSDLKQLEAEGVEILTCGTCLNHYHLTDQLKVGGVTNMYAIAEKMTGAGFVIKP